MPIINAILGELGQEAKGTIRVLERVPSEHLQWAPQMNHTDHQRGQLSLSPRLLGVPVPAVHGSRADEQM